MERAEVDSPILEVVSLECGPPEVCLLESVSFAVARGEVLAVLGANGEGKSTLFRTLAGLMPPRSGDMFVLGNPMPREPIDAGAVGLVLENLSDQFLATTIDEEIQLALACSSRSASTRPTELLESVGLPRDLERSPHSLSGGEQARLLLVLAILRRPQVLLLDDPFVFLGWPEALSILNFVKSLVTEKVMDACLFTTTETEFASLATSVMVLHQGTIALRGTPDVLFQSIPPSGLQRPLAQRCAEALPGDGVPWSSEWMPTEAWGKDLGERLL